MTGKRLCGLCDRPTSDVTICTTCTRRLERDLGDVTVLTSELDTTLARQGAAGPREGSRSAETPLFFSMAASEAIYNLHRTLAVWVDELHPLRTQHGPRHQQCQHPSCLLLWRQEPPANTPPALAAWLLYRIDRLPAHPAAAEIADEIGAAVGDARRVIDRNPERWYAGPCDTTGCTTTGRNAEGGVETRPSDLYATPTARTVTCPQCRTVYDVKDRRAWLLDAAQDQLAHAELIGRAVPALGVDITPAAIRGYAARGRIVAHSVNVAGDPLYRIGDVIDVARDVLSKKAESKAKAERAREARRAS